MNIGIVKNNLLQSFINSGILEKDLKHTIIKMNNIKAKNANNVARIVRKNLNTINNTINLYEKMYRINIIELDIFFSEFNRKNSDMNTKLVLLKNTLETIEKLCTELYFLYQIMVIMSLIMGGGEVDFTEEENRIKSYISKIKPMQKDISFFKYDIEIHNNKLRVGVRR